MAVTPASEIWGQSACRNGIILLLEPRHRRVDPRCPLTTLTAEEKRRRRVHKSESLFGIQRLPYVFALKFFCR